MIAYTHVNRMTQQSIEIEQLRATIAEQAARINELEDALREVKHCMSNVSVDSRWFDRGIATIVELIGE